MLVPRPGDGCCPRTGQTHHQTRDGLGRASSPAREFRMIAGAQLGHEGRHRRQHHQRGTRTQRGQHQNVEKCGHSWMYLSRWYRHHRCYCCYCCRRHRCGPERTFRLVSSHRWGRLACSSERRRIRQRASTLEPKHWALSLLPLQVVLHRSLARLLVRA